MVAARILAYGGQYKAEVVNPNTGDKQEYEFDLTQCEFKELPDNINYSENNFEIELPITKVKVGFKLLTGKDENSITDEIKSLKKIGQSAEITTRLKHLITSISGEDDKSKINNFVDNMLSKESLFFREEVLRISPDIDLEQEIDLEGETVKVAIPMTVDFFWPKAGS